MTKTVLGWEFIDSEGTFELPKPDRTNHLYFPLVNDTLMMSSITPRLHGDIKIDHHHYLMPPVSVYDLHNSRASRNFFLKVGNTLWSAAGNAAKQDPLEDETTLHAGLLWHKVTRANPGLGVEVEITNFVPQVDEHLELMKIKIRNTSDVPINLTPVAAIPLYGRSADRLRDHRHVTSLLNKVHLDQFGVVLTPTLSFDERGHNINAIQYAVLGATAEGLPPKFIYPDLNTFIGEGGALDRPLVDFNNPIDIIEQALILEGNEAIGGLRFEDIELAPRETCDFYLVLAIGASLFPMALIQQFASEEAFTRLFEMNKQHWANQLNAVQFYTGDARRDNWVRWVSLQPVLRRMMGNSFLPYHDYGRGGRGWRDLWQDALGLMLMETEDISEQLKAYFSGIRLDGSNATIIGNTPGEFKADRNNIPRVWMDHGAWPLKTMDLYFNLSGNYSFLLEEQSYFQDHLSHRSREVNLAYREKDTNIQTTVSGSVYIGTILEHLLVQHLTAFYNVGVHNNILLEGGDWNDGIDMANRFGESIAFSAFYADNIRRLSQYVEKLLDQGVSEIQVTPALSLLLDRCFGDEVDYERPEAKRTRLEKYLNSVSGLVPEEKLAAPLTLLRADLSAKAEWMVTHIRENEWLEQDPEKGWFNGYYDNSGERVEGFDSNSVRLTLTGQVFPIMSGVATKDQIVKILCATKAYLHDTKVGGYRLNTDFKGLQMDLGRAFGFAYGHKENGAMFSHMALMFAYALYEQGFPEEGYAIMEELYQHCQNFEVSKMYPGLPEYIGPDGRGYYPYLTGSASWYLFTLITQAFGVRGVEGDLFIEPKLMPDQFDADGTASIQTHFAERALKVTFHNRKKLKPKQYKFYQVLLDGEQVSIDADSNSAIIDRQTIQRLNRDKTHNITITLH